MFVVISTNMHALIQHMSVYNLISINRANENASAFQEKILSKNDFFLKGGILG